MRTLKDQIKTLADEIAQQELKFELRKRKRSSQTQEVFVQAVEWLVVDALAAQVGNKSSNLH